MEKIINKKKIFNDPVYGFVSVKSELIFDIIQHTFFQRLRRIKQLGLADFVYPGAIHTRFHHAIGAMHLMNEALVHLQQKGVYLFDAEIEAAQIAILLHDIGHGPFSHALEHSILNSVPHEDVSLLLMERLNEQFGGRLEMAIQIFKKEYPRKFLCQLVSSQLDIDRMDYLQRDCYFTGVNEGAIGADRIIKMLDVVDNQLVIEEKGIFSIENFLNARRLMYWQVYLHKTSIAAEQMLISIFKRAKYLVNEKQVSLFCSPALKTFLQNDVGFEQLSTDRSVLSSFAKLDDIDVWGAVKFWTDSVDRVLSYLCKSILARNLFKIEISNTQFDQDYVDQLSQKLTINNNLSDLDVAYLLVSGRATNEAYVTQGELIKVKSKSGELIDVAEASDLPNIKAISKLVTKHYIAYPKKLSL